VRVIAATNKKLELQVKEGAFREDLFYRLRIFAIHLPPLRGRADDIPILVEHFVRQFNREQGKNVRSIAPDAMQMLQRYDWPGNVRELQSAVKHAMVRSVGEVLTADFFPESCRDSVPGSDGDTRSPIDVDGIRQHVRSLLAKDRPGIYHKLHDEIDRILLPEVLDHVGGNQALASKLLGIARSTLRTKITDLGLAFEKRLRTEADRDD
jgi:two-component system nitrogen regulation response regulator GlnG